MLVAVGRIRVRADASRVRFLWITGLAYLQARRAPGAIHASVRRSDPEIFWSMSVWSTREAMMAYRNSASHLRAMQGSRTLASEVVFAHWDADAIPDWDEAMQRLQQR